LQDATDQTGLQDAGVAWTWAFAKESWVDGFDAEGLGWWAVHEDV
jgi:hypothetical protein